MGSIWFLFGSNGGQWKCDKNDLRWGSAKKDYKHIDIRYHHVRDEIGKTIAVDYVESNDQLADIFTKHLTPHHI